MTLNPPGVTGNSNWLKFDSGLGTGIVFCDATLVRIVTTLLRLFIYCLNYLFFEVMNI